MRSDIEPIDIILLTHNHLENTTRCIEALYANTKQSFKLTVIDDSTDTTPQYFQHLIENGDDINYHHYEKIYDANEALYKGLELTKSDPFIFLTNSTFVEPEWLFMALKIMNDDSKAGLVGFKILDPATNLIIEAGDHVFPDATRINIGMYDVGHRYSHIREVNAIGWAVVLMRRAVIPSEGFDSNYIPWRCAADLDNCLEIKKRGWKIYYNGLGSVYHKLGASQGDGTNYGRKEAGENCEYFEKKWKGQVPLIGKDGL